MLYWHQRVFECHSTTLTAQRGLWMPLEDFDCLKGSLNASRGLWLPQGVFECLLRTLTAPRGSLNVSRGLWLTQGVFECLSRTLTAPRSLWMSLEDFDCHGELFLTGQDRTTMKTVHADPKGNFDRPRQDHGKDGPCRPQREFWQSGIGPRQRRSTPTAEAGVRGKGCCRHADEWTYSKNVNQLNNPPLVWHILSVWGETIILAWVRD